MASTITAWPSCARFSPISRSPGELLQRVRQPPGAVVVQPPSGPINGPSLKSAGLQTFASFPPSAMTVVLPREVEVWQSAVEVFLSRIRPSGR